MTRATIFAMLLLLMSAPALLCADGLVDIDLSSGNHPEIGSAAAPVTIIEFSDFECPNCRRLEPALLALRRDDASRIRFVWMDFPLEVHRHAMLAAVAARCAGEQGQFWPYHDALMSGREALSEGNLKDLGDRLGLEPNKFSLCLAQRRYEGVVESDLDAGDAIGISGTPSLIFNGRLYTGGLSFAELEAAVDSAQTGAASHASPAQP
jgi:protein-disulfide isomerase